MTVKRKHMSVKNYRRLIRIPAHKRLDDYIRAGWLRYYKVRKLGKDVNIH